MSYIMTNKFPIGIPYRSQLIVGLQTEKNINIVSISNLFAIFGKNKYDLKNEPKRLPNSKANNEKLKELMSLTHLNNEICYY